MQKPFEDLPDWGFFTLLNTVGLKIPEENRPFFGGHNTILGSRSGITAETLDPRTEVGECAQGHGLNRLLAGWRGSVSTRNQDSFLQLDALLLDVFIPQSHDSRQEFFPYGLLGVQV